MKHKKYIIIGSVLLFIILTTVFCVNSISYNKNEKIQEKVVSEIDFFERYLIDALNKVQKINLKQNVIEEGEIDWKELKDKTEEIYMSIPTSTLDLYTAGIDQIKVLNFNKDFDLVINCINKKDKSQLARVLSKLYSYLPDYMEKLGEDNRKINILKAKSNLFNAYSLLENEKWKEMNDYINLAIENIALVVGNIEDSENSYMESKCYIQLNELLNSINSEDKTTFLIKYKNLVEDLKNL